MRAGWCRVGSSPLEGINNMAHFLIEYPDVVAIVGLVIVLLLHIPVWFGE
jgi:hypothetical protein